MVLLVYVNIFKVEVVGYVVCCVVVKEVLNFIFILFLI